MQKRILIPSFITIHILFIFLQIHKHSWLVELSYKKQKNEKVRQELLEKKNDLIQQWYMIQNRADIKKFAYNELGMRKITLSQIKQLPS